MNVAISRNSILNMRQESYVCLSVCLSFWLAVSLSLLSLSVSLFPPSFPFLSPSRRPHSLYVVRCITSDPIELPSSVHE